MNSIGKLIKEARQAKGLSQEKLAVITNLNARTIQRIEAGENEPRGETLKLLCSALGLNIDSLHNQLKPKKEVHHKVINFTFLIILNFLMMFLIGFLTIDSEANLNSRIGAFLLSILIPYFIVLKTEHLEPSKRVMKYGTGFILYIVLATSITNFAAPVVFYLVPFLLIAIAILFYGNSFVKPRNTKG